jgi:hypothetical protein
MYVRYVQVRYLIEKNHYEYEEIAFNMTILLVRIKFQIEIIELQH